MALRFLADTAKIPLTHSTYGYMTFNGTFNGIPRTYVLDTTLPGLAHTCQYHLLGQIGARDPWNETCPNECTSQLTIPLLTSDDGTVHADAIAGNLTFAGIAIPSFKSGRICGGEILHVFEAMSKVANCAFGLGPAAPKGYENVTKELDTIPWSKYSIYVSNTSADDGSFLLPGGVDTDLIAKEKLIETKLPATTETGWTVKIDGFTNSGASINAECSPTSPCSATVAASSPVLQLGKDIWASVMAGIDRQACYKSMQNGISEDFLYQCYDWVKLPTLSFTLGDRTFTLNATDYTVPIPKSDTRSVMVMIAPQNRNTSYNSEWILGAPFLRAYYSAFDKDAKTVSFYCKDGVNCVAKGKPAPGTTNSSAPTMGWKWASVLVLASTVLMMV